MRFPLVGFLSVFLFVGCASSDYSMNMRVATVESTAILGTRALLDEVKTENYLNAREGIITIVEALDEFLATGELAKLPKEAVRAKILEFLVSKGYSGYMGLVDSVMAWVEVQHVNVGAIGSNNLALIRIGLLRISQSAKMSRPEWRRDGGDGIYVMDRSLTESKPDPRLSKKWFD